MNQFTLIILGNVWLIAIILGIVLAYNKIISGKGTVILYAIGYLIQFIIFFLFAI